MASRIIALVLILIILIGGGILIFRFFRGPVATSSKTITINKDGKFDQSEIKLKNNEVFKIRNDDNVKQSVKKSSDKSTLVELETGKTSRELKLSNDTKNELYLASSTGEKTSVVVGTPASTQTAPAATEKPTGAVASTTQNLPNTGPGDNFIFFLVIVLGFGLLKASNVYWKFVRR